MSVTLKLICVLKPAGILLDHTHVAVGMAIVSTEMDTLAMVFTKLVYQGGLNNPFSKYRTCHEHILIFLQSARQVGKCPVAL